MSLDACLPPDLRTETTAITKIGIGYSGAGVYRVEAAGRTFVLKVAPEHEPPDAWRRRVEVLRLAASAGLAPVVVHVDEARRAVVSEFVVDRSFPALLMDPRTRDAAIVLLGQTLRRVHELPLPADVERPEPLALLATFWGRLDGFAVPSFVREAVARVLAERPPAAERPLVLSHNDVNPTNLVYDGERVLLLDWDAAGENEPLYDLATVAVFMRMDDATCAALLAAHDGAAVGSLPRRFVYDRRLVAVLCGTGFLQLARATGHAGATGDETLEATDGLPAFYQKLRAGQIDLGGPQGRWAFGLALVKSAA